MIPRLTGIMDWVKGEMDEMEREEFFRVKKVVEKKKQRHDKELQAQLDEMRAQMAGGAAAPPGKKGGAQLQGLGIRREFFSLFIHLGGERVRSRIGYHHHQRGVFLQTQFSQTRY